MGSSRSGAPKTLYRKRLDGLQRLVVRRDSAGNVFGWEEVPDSPCHWTVPILCCYDHLSESQAGRSTDLTYAVLCVAAPLGADGRLLGEMSLPQPMLSGEDTGSVPVGLTARQDAAPGYCAERKWLGTRHARDWSASRIWLMYTTSSPCRGCVSALLAQLAPAGQPGKGWYDHLVVAFEGCYQPDDGWRASPSAEELRERLRHSYEPERPGIEFFKVARDPAACERDKQCWQQMTPEEQAHQQSSSFLEDSQLKVIRVAPQWVLH